MWTSVLGILDVVCFLCYLRIDVAAVLCDHDHDGTPRLKYVLGWHPFYLIDTSQGNVFSTLNCSVSNCVYTEDRKLLGDYSRFDAILFYQAYLNTENLKPTRRTNSQLYIFATVESRAIYPACKLHNDNFFNWTFTFRLDSDVVWNYFIVRDVAGDIVAPSKEVEWVKYNKNSISPKIRSILQGRKKAAAWLVTNCDAPSKREIYLTKLQEHLFHYSLTIDVFGGCTNVACENGDCEEMLRNKYYFYMAFENAIVEDYVTEKVLHGYDNYVVPVVFGGANYSRFLPPDSYINAQDYHPYNLANIIYRAIENISIYEGYFKWTNFYTIDSSNIPTPRGKLSNPLCDLCAALHSSRANHAPAKKYFRFWWNGMNGMQSCLPSFIDPFI